MNELMEDIIFSKSSDSDMKRENANIDADTAMGTMLKCGSEASKRYYLDKVISRSHAYMHKSGDIHIHDMDFYALTTTCCQIELRKLFKGGFSTGHGVLREPNDIHSYAALACIAIQSNQNDQHGGQSVCDFDYAMADGVRKTYAKLHEKHMDDLMTLGMAEEEALSIAENRAWRDVERATYQAMEALIHNLNTMHSRAGAQTPFSSINYGMDTSREGRLVIRCMLEATMAGLGFGETPIFPVQIFRVKEGVNYNPEDQNYDLFKLAMECSAKRLFPNFSFMDAPFNAQYYKGTPETEVAYMGCRTRVMGNVYDTEAQVTPGRGNLSFTSINLPRIGIISEGDWDRFWLHLDARLRVVVDQLTDRFEVQASRKVYNAPFLMGQGVWRCSENLAYDDEQRDVLKHGTLTVGFIGLAECLVAMTGKHHGESAESQRLGLEIVGHMREYMDRVSRERGMNYTLIATPAEGLSGRFVRLDREYFGSIEGVTDRDYYTNGFHVPVHCSISAFDKIEVEAPYHALTNGGHISYVELDGDVAKNTEAFEAVVRHMKESGMGYGSVNHPVDRCPKCGHNGVIDDECPVCGNAEGIERIRRITGYLVGTLDRFNDAKRAEERERVKHSCE